MHPQICLLRLALPDFSRHHVSTLAFTYQYSYSFGGPYLKFAVLNLIIRHCQTSLRCTWLISVYLHGLYFTLGMAILPVPTLI